MKSKTCEIKHNTRYFMIFYYYFSLKININNTFMHHNLGCGWDHMRGNRCEWGFIDAAGCRGKSAQQNKETRGHLGSQRAWLGPMAGEISPHIMFWKKKVKRGTAAPDGYTWDRMSVVVCIWTEGQENKGKRGNSVIRTCFARTTKTRSWQGWSRGGDVTTY